MPISFRLGSIRKNCSHAKTAHQRGARPGIFLTENSARFRSAPPRLPPLRSVRSRAAVPPPINPKNKLIFPKIHANQYPKTPNPPKIPFSQSPLPLFSPLLPICKLSNTFFSQRCFIIQSSNQPTREQGAKTQSAKNAICERRPIHKLPHERK